MQEPHRGPLLRHGAQGVALQLRQQRAAQRHARVAAVCLGPECGRCCEQGRQRLGGLRGPTAVLRGRLPQTFHQAQTLQTWQ